MRASSRRAALEGALLCFAVLSGCGGAASSSDTTARASAERDPRTLLEEVTTFSARIEGARPPFPSPPEPPTASELAWMLDRSAPVAERMELARLLMQASLRIVHAYFDADPTSSDGLRWITAVVREQGTIMAILLDEVLPTVSPADPSYATRMDGVRQMAHGSIELVLGVTEVLPGAHFAPALRRDLVDAVRDQLGTFARIWSAEERAQVTAALERTRATERDPEVAATLADACAVLAGP